MAKPLTIDLTAQPASRVISEDAIRGMIKRWRRGTGHQADLADRWAKILDGEIFAECGERDLIIFQLAGTTAAEFPDLKPDDIVKHFERSLSLMALDAQNNGVDPITIDLVRDKFHSACGKVIAERALTEQTQANSAAENISKAFGSDRTEPYTAEEIETIGAALGCEPGEVNRCWVLLHGSHYYLWDPAQNNYSVQTDTSLILAARVALSPCGIELTRVTTNGGSRSITVQELMANHAQAVNHVRLSLTADHPSIDWATKTLTLASAPKRDLQPEHSQEIDRWLDILGGDVLKRWLSLATKLDQPTCALVMVGHKGAGKSLLAMGLSRIWTLQGPTNLSSIQKYDSALMSCPIVFADEGLPKDFRGNTDTTTLRQLVQSTTRSINVKYGPQLPLDGAIRLILAANNDGILETQGHQTVDDIAAVAERFFTIQTTSESERYLDSIGGRAHIDPVWIKGDALAKHILWLCERPAAWEGRFGIAHDSAGIATKMGIRNGIRSKICEWLVRLILGGQKVPGVEAHPEGVILTVKALTENWDCVFDRHSAPGTTIASRALQELAVECDGPHCAVDLKTLLGWVEATHYCSERDLIECLNA